MLGAEIPSQLLTANGTAFSIAPKSDPLLPFLGFCIRRTFFLMDSTRKQPALLLQLDPCFQLPLRLKQREKVQWCPLGGCGVR